MNKNSYVIITVTLILSPLHLEALSPLAPFKNREMEAQGGPVACPRPSK